MYNRKRSAAMLHCFSSTIHKTRGSTPPSAIQIELSAIQVGGAFGLGGGGGGEFNR
jgi:hypothetical protein